MAINLNNLDSAISSLTWFFMNNKKNYHWEGLSSCPYSSAYVLMSTSLALREKTTSMSTILSDLKEGSLNYLISSQNIDGSWGQDNALFEKIWITPVVALAISTYLETSGTNQKSNTRIKKTLYQANKYLQRTLNYVSLLNIDTELIDLSLLPVIKWNKLLDSPLDLKYQPKNALSHYSHLLKQNWVSRVAELPVIDYVLPDIITNNDLELFFKIWKEKLPNGSIACITHYSALILLACIKLGLQSKLDTKDLITFLMKSQNPKNKGFPEFYNYEIFTTVYPAWLLSLSSIHVDSYNFLEGVDKWTLTQQNSDGTWSFTYEFPKGDMDDTSCSIAWLMERHRISKDNGSVKKFLKVLPNFVSASGGISSWKTIEKPEIDVTAHTIAALRHIFPPQNELIENAITYLEKRQNKNGSWIPSWHLSPIYGTSQVLLSTNNLNLSSEYESKAELFLTNYIHEDKIRNLSLEEIALLGLSLVNSTRCNDYEGEILKLIDFLLHKNISQTFEHNKKLWIAIYTYTTSTFQPGALLAFLSAARNFIKGKTQS